MKKLLLIFSLTIALSFSSKAQTSVYHPFPDSDAVWNESAFCGMPHFSESYSYILNKDTLIGGKTYHKLIIPDIKGDTSGPLHTKGYNGCIRQDIPGKKVFYISPNDTIEKILYDFNLQVGDTFLRFAPIHYCDIGFGIDIVSNIDSMLIGGDYRKVWQVAQGTYSIIEGIGAIQRNNSGGLLEATCLNCIVTELWCFKQNGVTLYPDSTSSCNIVSTVNNLSEKNISITVSPNPFHSIATLEIKNEELKIKNAELKVYDIMGRVVRQQIITNQSTIINRDGLGDGLYFYQLRTTNYELIASGKFVVD